MCLAGLGSISVPETKLKSQKTLSDIYLPSMHAATELSTVFEILNQSELIRRNLSLDQALFAKAAEVVWKQKDKFSHILLRMGTFHTICNALSIIGKLFQDAGLKDICIEAGIVAEGSIRGVLDRKYYNRAVRVYKCIYQALMRLAWTEFTLWVEENQEMILQSQHSWTWWTPWLVI